MRLAFVAIAAALCASAALAAPQSYSWDGYGTGAGACTRYKFHVEFVADGGKVAGFWQQKDREVRKFDLPLQADGKFAGKVNIGTGDMQVSGTVAGTASIKLSGYCDFGGPLKKA